MKLKDFLKEVGPAVLATVYPPAAPIIGAINMLIPEGGKPLLEKASGDDVLEAINTIEPNKRSILLEREIEYETEVIKQRAAAMNTANASQNENYQKTRAFIARWSFIVVAFVTVGITAVWGEAVYRGDGKAIQALSGSWPMILTLLGPFSLILKTYMGVLAAENRDRLNAANGKTAASGLVLALSALTRAKK